MASVFLEEFKRYLEFDVTDDREDTLLDIVLLGTQSFIGSVYGTVIGQQVVTDTLNGNGQAYYYLNQSPIVTISSLSIDGTAVDIGDYYFKDNEIRMITGTFTSGTQNVDINYTIGYDTSDIPDDLKLALFKIAEKMYYDASQNRDGVSVISNDIKQRASFVDKIPLVAESILNSYRVIRF